MYLSDKKAGIIRGEDSDHEELEVLLESFSKQVEEVVNEAENIEVLKFGSVYLSSFSTITYRITSNLLKRS